LDGDEFLRKEFGSLHQNLPLLVDQAPDSSNFGTVDFLATGRHECKSSFNSNLQACLAMRQGWIIFSKEVLGELVKPLGMCGLREKVREDAFKHSPRTLQALARQGAFQLEDGESI
jgi:hypothetical protein